MDEIYVLPRIQLLLAFPLAVRRALQLDNVVHVAVVVVVVVVVIVVVVIVALLLVVMVVVVVLVVVVIGSVINFNSHFTIQRHILDTVELSLSINWLV